MLSFHHFAILFSVISISACSSPEVIPSGDAGRMLNDDIRGYKVRNGVIIGRDLTANWVQLAVSGYEPASAPQAPAKVNIVAASTACEFKLPAADEFLANIHVTESELQSSVYALSKGKMADRAKRYIDSYVKDGPSADPDTDQHGDNMNVVDVVVTETSKPVYLVLSHVRNVIWNIQTHEKARISRVAIIGSGNSGIANLDKGVPVTILNGENLKRCRVQPRRRPADHWLFVKRAKKTPSFQETLQENVSAYGKYSNWFTDNFGQGSETGVIGIETVSHVLVGPLPPALEMRVVYKPLEGADVKVTDPGKILVTDERTYKATVKALVADLAAKAAGGDLKNLIPKS